MAFALSLGVSLAALALLGLGIGRMTRRPLGYTALRQILLGGVAAAVTFAVGTLIGVQA
jgi:VIT1/CCC1 family predicted Fe2+/Mn2+ transporter